MADGQDDDQHHPDGAPRGRKLSKLGVMKRLFSFRRTSSTTKFNVDQSAARTDPTIGETHVPVLDIGVASEIGFHHEYNEDYATIVEDLLGADAPAGLQDKDYYGTHSRACTYLAVFDGHGGKECSEWAGDKVHEYLTPLLFKANFPDLIGTALHHAFKTNEEAFCDWAKANNCSSGSCATAVLIKGDLLYCANAGDSKAIVFRDDGRGNAADLVELNERHGAELASERKRILAAGGTIAPDGAVYGVLFPTRGFGDIDVKADRKPVIIATPTGAGVGVPPYKLQKTGESFLVLATDGLWDFATDRDISASVLKGYASHKSSEAVAKELIFLARRGGSEDDITIVVSRINFE